MLKSDSLQLLVYMLLCFVVVFYVFVVKHVVMLGLLNAIQINSKLDLGSLSVYRTVYRSMIFTPRSLLAAGVLLCPPSVCLSCLFDDATTLTRQHRQLST